MEVKIVKLLMKFLLKVLIFSASKGCCGWYIFGPIGLLCGSCGGGKKVINNNYWVCNNCGRKWKA